jgi:hypothetical protein
MIWTLLTIAGLTHTVRSPPGDIGFFKRVGYQKTSLFSAKSNLFHFWVKDLAAVGIPLLIEPIKSLTNKLRSRIVPKTRRVWRTRPKTKYVQPNLEK